VSRLTTLTPLLLLLAACSGSDSGAANRPAAPDTLPAVAAPPAAPAPSAAGSVSAPADTMPADTTTPPRDPAEWRVTERGIGPLRAGMTRAEAEGALGSKLDFTPAQEGCAMVPIPGAPAGTVVLMVNDTLARVDVFRASTTETAAGARIGDTGDRIRSLYPGRVRAEPHKYTEGQYLIVPAQSDTTYRLVFETDEQGRVTRYRGGRLPEVGWVEGCS
jgi:hypothetical protein